MKKIDTVACLGAGVIGASWAACFAKQGCQVRLYDIKDEFLTDAQRRIRRDLSFLAEKGYLAQEDVERAMERITYTTDLASAVTGAGFIQESGPENYEVKRTIMEEVDRSAPADAIYASSTSGLLITEIAKASAHPERCVGGHPYNPPLLIPLVEITKTEKTDPANVELAKEFYQALGKEPVVLHKDCPGYICNRLQLAVFREMVDLVERGVCSVEDADKALTFGPAIRWAIFGHNMIMQLGNKDGLAGMMDMLGGGFNLCGDIANWTEIPADYKEKGQAGVDEEMKNFSDEIGHTNEECIRYRDKMLIEILKLHHKF